MAEQFYTIPTAIGKARIANSIALGTKINLTTMKIGDSNGSYYNPNEGQTDLVHSVYSCNINSVAVDEDNANWINIICALPSDVGDFYIREAGAFDDTGSLIAIGKYPETYKPIATNGSTKEIYIKMTLEVTSTSSIELKIDPTVVLATKKDIDILTNSINSITTQLSEKANDTDSSRTTTSKTVTGAINELNANKAPLASPAFTGTATLNSVSLATTTKPTEVTVTPQNGFTTAPGSNATYIKTQSGVVTLNIFLNNTASSAIGTIMFTLPTGYRPSNIVRARGIIGYSSSIYSAEIFVNSDGTVKLNSISNSITSYANIQFDVSFVATN